MPRYFFNIKNHIDAQDFFGRVLPNLEIAKCEAHKDVEEIMRAPFTTLGNNWTKWSIEIRNIGGDLLSVVPFSSN